MAKPGRIPTLDVFARRKRAGERIAVLTAYDLASARMAAAGGVDALLVGDSLGMVVMGHDTTLPVELAHMLHHTAAVVRAGSGLPVIADMPYGSFHVEPARTVEAGLRLVKEAGATAVKVEGGRARADHIEALLAAEIPVMGHLGLTPQSVNRLGGFKVQGRGADAAARLLQEARFLQEAGCFALVLECIPAELAATVSRQLAIPTVGIGAGVRLRRAGAGDPRHARAGRRPRAPLRQALRRPGKPGRRGGGALRGRCARGHLPGTRARLRRRVRRVRASGVRGGGRLPGRCAGRRGRGVRVLRSAADLGRLDSLRGERPLVLVPTMGALHEGHLSLVRRAADLGPVVVSIFVNPTQFGPNEDFAAYPRELARDLELLEPLAPAAIFAPETATVYPSSDGVTIRPGRRATGLCGAGRPDHFAGVLTVVAKLFGLVRPDLAVFGRKDAQQCLVIAEMVRDLMLPVRLLDAPTVREPDGLAMSSRNRYLDAAARARALCLSRALAAARALIDGGERAAPVVIAAMDEHLRTADSAEYAAIRRLDDWSEPQQLGGRVLLAVAARVEPARLIDNLVLDITGEGARECSLLGTGDEA